MNATLTTLLAAHLVADFVLQTRWIIDRKTKFGVLLLHVAIVVSLSAVALGALHAPILLIIAVTHLAADYAKASLFPDRQGRVAAADAKKTDDLVPFVADQIVHASVIVLLSFIFRDAYANGVWPNLFGDGHQRYLAATTVVAGFVAAVIAGGVLISKAIARFRDQLPDDAGKAGLRGGGAIIGCLERALIFVLVLMGEPAGVGFLITAKSILRIGDVKDGEDRALAEYIIIGTFMSFGWALFVAELTRLALP